MEVTEIKLEDNALVFYAGTDDIYTIPRNDLASKLNDGVSEWIHQLSEKSWATSELLKDVASKIKQEFPDNDIDWEQTDLIIENQ